MRYENHVVKYIIDDQEFNFTLVGNVRKGDEHVLLEQDQNLLEGTPWNDVGYTVQPFLNEAQVNAVYKGISDKVKILIERCGGCVDHNFKLENYHNCVSNEVHLKLVNIIKEEGWKAEDFPIQMDALTGCIEALLNKKLTVRAPDPLVKEFAIRIVRPGKLFDNNPPHRDVWLDRLRNAINIYYPIAGSTIKSSLPILPGSHKLKESELIRTTEGAALNGTKYTVPCAITVNENTIHMIRPNPGRGEVLLFSPYLIHGGGYNLNENETRVSLEMRFWLRA